MMQTTFDIILSRSADKAQRRLDVPLRRRILAALQLLAQNPTELAEQLRSPLGDFYCHHITYQGKEYRIAFKLEATLIYVVLIGPHENFYRKLKLKSA